METIRTEQDYIKDAIIVAMKHLRADDYVRPLTCRVHYWVNVGLASIKWTEGESREVTVEEVTQALRQLELEGVLEQIVRVQFRKRTVQWSFRARY